VFERFLDLGRRVCVTMNFDATYVPEHRNSSLRHRIPSDRTDGAAVTARCDGNTPDNAGKTPPRKTAEAK